MILIDPKEKSPLNLAGDIGISGIKVRDSKIKKIPTINIIANSFQF